jgi:aquaglyceroporin related protein
MILVIFGTGVDCQVVLSTNTGVASSPKGVRTFLSAARTASVAYALRHQDYLSISFGWAVGTALGVWFAGGVSGGHINPAVSSISSHVC